MADSSASIRCFVDESTVSHGAWTGSTSELLNCRREVLYDSSFGSRCSMNGRSRESIRSEDASPLTPTRDSPSTHARPHAAVEQKYRRTLNSKLQQLNSSIPLTGKFAPPTGETAELRPDNEKSESAAKPAVLDKAIQYVAHLGASQRVAWGGRLLARPKHGQQARTSNAIVSDVLYLAFLEIDLGSYCPRKILRLLLNIESDSIQIHIQY
ncbi:uncharacterized protein MYCFIDRAFT_170379 [Pseudocercospora fijiensis CIRAD86]|uniref:BHLH domain-containing protein n=1 Tax=Pseudocercospora fijiensis (strain CIRAD86) TaxID=383855 RepID=N1Q7S6_PSEFD|nr:uncharacterized protein MYCFIDRAFT_170379 [Pseudocercospora fijiensis CIRAD86]EME88804.1 hypothetical protein MYCFIDRAFT_170379 [Pseudocercospora fijiensis CIRAD86]